MFKRTVIKTSPFKIGDKVRCVDNENSGRDLDLELFGIYTVSNIDSLGIKLNETGCWYIESRFINVTRELKLKRVLKCIK